MKAAPNLHATVTPDKYAGSYIDHMVSNAQNPSFLDRVQIRMVDTNGDGRLEASELMAYQRSVLADLGISGMLSPSSIDERSVEQLETNTLEKARSKYANYARQHLPQFPCGIEMPSDQQIADMVALEHQHAYNMRGQLSDIHMHRTFSSLATKMNGVMLGIGLGVLRGGDGLLAVAEATFDSIWPSHSCSPQQQPSHHR